MSSLKAFLDPAKSRKSVPWFCAGGRYTQQGQPQFLRGIPHALQCTDDGAESFPRVLASRPSAMPLATRAAIKYHRLPPRESHRRRGGRREEEAGVLGVSLSLLWQGSPGMLEKRRIAMTTTLWSSLTSEKPATSALLKNSVGAFIYERMVFFCQFASFFSGS